MPNDDFKSYVKKLRKFSDDVLPRVVAETIDRTASFAHAGSAQNIRRRFVNRTKYTENSLRYWKAVPKKNIERINAVTGSISDYMDEQDEGGVRRPKSGRKAPVTTLYARGGNSARKKLARQKLGQSLDRTKYFVGKPRGNGRNAGKPVGIYERVNKNKKIRMTHNLSRGTVPIRAAHWHTDAMKNRTKDHLQDAFIQEAKRELAKLGAK